MFLCPLVFGGLMEIQPPLHPPSCVYRNGRIDVCSFAVGMWRANGNPNPCTDLYINRNGRTDICFLVCWYVEG